MNRAIALVLLAGCAQRAPTPTVALALPVPPPTASIAPIAPPDTKPPLDDGDFSSERGMVHLMAAPDGVITGTFEGGILTCKSSGDGMGCRWYVRSGEGRARFHRKSDGRLEGTWGTEKSEDDQGAWTLVPIARSFPLEGLWDTNWGHAAIHATAHGLHIDYDAGSMECEQRDKTLVCTWTENGTSGTAELVIESSHVLRGNWGSGKSTTDGGPWVFVKRP